ncbi:MAG: DNA-directed RNA polymerase subunit beta' [Chitinispirillales bacterium]|nr:DNA-directed RNA polymerase subunit beta' [Chitinispirillales bacterium]
MNGNYTKHTKETEIHNVGISIASPEKIRDWSHGEVTKPETINYRSYKPEKDGLFCEKIFGPVRSWECNCGKYKRVRYKGIVCDRCGVEVTDSKVRRERMGHIELGVPVVHEWYSKSGFVAQILGLKNNEVDKITYYENYIVIDKGDTDLIENTLIDDATFDKYESEGKKFVAKMGGDAIFDLLSKVDLEDLRDHLYNLVKNTTSKQNKADLLKRLKVVKDFCNSGNNPQDMVLQALPVLPPDLRPLVPLEGGRFATSDLNDLYRRVINRNNRLKKMKEISAPEVILRNEKRMLQESVDTLFDNSKNGRKAMEGKRPLKSLTDLLKGKQGRFRMNLLGKRVDYSGRSVIVVGPELKIYQCGLPKPMALELFKPFVFKVLQEREHVQTIKGAKKFVEKERTEVWDILEEVIKDHPVLLNRAPTLHRLGIQAFFPILVEGKAIRLHPLVCTAFNADFDGDQMAVHVPLSPESIVEARLLMLSANNILRPSSGDPVMVPSQDMVLGIYYLTKENREKKTLLKGLAGKDELRIFDSIDELQYALAGKEIELHSIIRYVIPEKWRLEGQPRIIETTPGRIIFNQAIPESIGFQNETMKKSTIEKLVGKIMKTCGAKETTIFLDNVKDLGYKYATISGTTFGIEDLVVPDERQEIIEKASEESKKIRKQYQRGVITEGERYNKIVDIWTHATESISNVLFEKLQQDRNGFNPVYMMIDAKARGSKDQIKQLAGMRGLMQRPQKNLTGSVGEIIENPILSNFKDGLTGLEYFISTHGARKGLADTALKTADAGYLTRRLVDVVQDMVVSQQDCGTVRGVNITALIEDETIIESLASRIAGRVALSDIIDPKNGNIFVKKNEMISDIAAEQIEKSGLDSVKVRSVLTCESDFGLCARCYGKNLATQRLVDIGEAVGIMAAQSIGEPGTQLTLRTFHTGGAASRLASKSEEIANFDGKIEFQDVEAVSHSSGNVVISRNATIILSANNGGSRKDYEVPHGSILYVENGKSVKKGDKLLSWDSYNAVILATKTGTIEGVDIKEGITLKEAFDELTRMTERVIVEDKAHKRHPHLRIVPEDGSASLNIALPVGALLQVAIGSKVTVGDILYKIPRESGKSKDITGGLPRVAELFEARKPKDPTIISEVAGIVEFKMRPVKDEKGHIVKGGNGIELREPDIERGNRKILVHTEDGDTVEYSIPVRKHLRVYDGDRVHVGDRLCEGSMDPHEILRVLGEHEVQKYLINEIQSVYRLQGVAIDDKHVEVIISQMLGKVEVEEQCDSKYLEGDQVDKREMRLEIERLRSEGKELPRTRALLLGLTKASLRTESFLSAASFQDTTKVLSHAAMEAKVDCLQGLKENIIMGNIIPAGTGSVELRNLQVRDIEIGGYSDGFGDLESELSNEDDKLFGEIV